ncbi:[NiFe]-hydrogenase assembly chaperone HybE [Aidingimonas halophila]|uniref:[NiFe] hydrogenase assembly chaperone, HybE family n=1 Tax=Aidingimonas halophila TaxID=574349 RepID=A0A1H3BTW7_9GAMM|nr:[NiFe]-hydrogenase assembly chaperone HybE [Aidingimonas halophila]GHC27115.1 hypothetical protein GCM10008094_18260 [Aidingimonas halophila]SDX45191.1 Protein of unknown function [Aidingimonas halophila]
MQALSQSQYEELRELSRCYYRHHLSAFKHSAHRNSRLSVDLLCCQPWGDELCGALITPLALSLVLIPATPHRVVPADGEQRLKRLPDGEYPFVAEHLPDGRWLWRCQLLDDMHEFDGVEDANRLAQYLLQRVMTSSTGADHQG